MPRCRRCHQRFSAFSFWGFSGFFGVFRGLRGFWGLFLADGLARTPVDLVRFCLAIGRLNCHWVNFYGRHCVCVRVFLSYFKRASREMVAKCLNRWRKLQLNWKHINFPFCTDVPIECYCGMLVGFIFTIRSIWLQHLGVDRVLRS